MALKGKPSSSEGKPGHFRSTELKIYHPSNYPVDGLISDLGRCIGEACLLFSSMILDRLANNASYRKDFKVPIQATQLREAIGSRASALR